MNGQKKRPRREQAQSIWIESSGERLLKDIAANFSVSDTHIRKWKSIDKWSDDLNGNVTNDKSNFTIQKELRLEIWNAVENPVNSRASPPVGNKNAVKTGQFEQMYFDLLSADEKAIYLADFSFTERLKQDI